MSVLYNGFEPTLKFFGTMNGSSKSHTNAFFCPDEETIVFIDMSLLNAYEAENVIRARPKLKHFYACVTHNHFDHVSGLGKLAFDVKNYFPGSLLTIIVDEGIREETVTHLDTEGLGPRINQAFDRDGVYNLLSFDKYGAAYAFYQGDGTPRNRMVKPKWLVQTIPVAHSPRLKGASGFVLNNRGTLIIYSGDTNQLDPYECFLDSNIHKYNEDGDPPIEFYLDVSTRKNPLHLNFSDIAYNLEKLLDSYTSMKIILMHYDDVIELSRQVNKLVPDEYGDCIFVARKSF